jgi:MFS family permease
VTVPNQRNLPLLWSAQFISTVGLTMLVPLLPFYLEELGASGSSRQLWTGLTLAAPALTLAVASPLWGALGDRCGRKWMVVRGLVGLAVVMALMAMARTPVQLLAARLAQGAFGGVTEASAALLGSEEAEERRGRALGRLQSALAAGALTGPLAGGLLGDVLGIRPPLLIAACLTMGSGVLAAFILKEQYSGSPQRRRPLRFSQAFAPLAGRPPARGILVAGLGANAAAYGLLTIFGPHMREMLSQPSRAGSWVGILQAITWAAALVGAPWWGRRNDRGKVEANLQLALLGCSLAVCLQALVAVPEWLVPARILQGFCFAAVSQSVLLQATRIAGPHRQGTLVGAANSFLVGGHVLGALGGGLVSALLASEGAVLAMAGLFAFSGLAAPGALRMGLKRRPIETWQAS